jgi:hypothetical protein
MKDHKVRLNQAYSNIPPGSEILISARLKKAPNPAIIHIIPGGDFDILNASHNGTAYNSQTPNPRGVHISMIKIPNVSRIMKIEQ